MLAWGTSDVVFVEQWILWYIVNLHKLLQNREKNAFEVPTEKYNQLWRTVLYLTILVINEWNLSGRVFFYSSMTYFLFIFDIFLTDI